MFEIIRCVILWTFSIVFSSVAILRLLVLHLSKFKSAPWKPKERTVAPALLSDPKYGQHKFATVNGIRMHYVEAGDKSKPLMVFVHGFPEFWYSWRNQITEFSKDYWTVAIDMRGYNLSERPVGLQNYSFQYMVDDLRGLIEYLNRKKFILVAHDWGSLISWEFTSQNKHMVYKYAMMGAPSRRVFKKTFNSSMDQFKRSWYMSLFQMPFLPELSMMSDDFGLFNIIWEDQLGDSFTEEDLEAYKYTFSRPGALTAAINYYRANFGTRGNELQSSSKNRLDGSDGMYVLGELEQYISKNTLELTAKEYPKIRIEVVPGANHFLQHHTPQAVNDLLRDFLGSAAHDCPIEPLI
ncbi:epoxide hydrolase 2-like [Sitodiplosis mosellana]|uniref:epoxide hydrolase 2-like n=1 Tax=Sitodiplosis mosellana TaxID=263140 RepID=UPI0024450D33|nr:epoxide hydrolase 2-like [Sitodiplosis mosellana]XP_055311529.1 epoxide hydrolase 2-like [Sitodiplosis mosellana]